MFKLSWNPSTEDLHPQIFVRQFGDHCVVGGVFSLKELQRSNPTKSWRYWAEFWHHWCPLKDSYNFQLPTKNNEGTTVLMFSLYSLRTNFFPSNWIPRQIRSNQIRLPLDFKQPKLKIKACSSFNLRSPAEIKLVLTHVFLASDGWEFLFKQDHSRRKRAILFPICCSSQLPNSPLRKNLL